MKQIAQKLASKGRFGDSMLVHMNPEEVSGLASLMPENELSINPETGLPEAFFFLPALAALAPALAGTAAAAAPAAAAAVPAMAGLGALGTGVGAGMGAAGLGAASMAPALAAPAITAATAAPALAASAAPLAAPAALGALESTAPAIAATTAPISGTTAAMPAISTPTMSSIPAGGLPSIGPGAPMAQGPGGATMMSPGSPYFSPEMASSKMGLPGSVTGNMPGLPPQPSIGSTPSAPSISGPNSIPRPRPSSQPYGSNVGLNNFGTVNGEVPTTAGSTGEPMNLLEGEAKSGIFGNMKNALLPAVLGYGLLNQGGDGPDKKEYDSSGESRYVRSGPEFPDENYDPGKTGEFSYFRGEYVPRFHQGGIVGGPNQKPAPNLSAFNNPGTQAVNNTMPNQAINNVAPQAQANSPVFGGNNPMAQGVASLPQNNGARGPTYGGPPAGVQPPSYGGISPSPTYGWGAGSDVSNQRYAEGGIVKKPVDNSYAEGGLAGLNSPSMMGQETPGGIMPESGTESQDKQLVAMTVAAIQGQIPNAEKIIQLFIETFGEEALMDLMERIQGGDGKSDSIPAQINSPQGSQPAQLSEGEYIVPADVVSNMGKGSTDAGGRQLDNMVAGQRMQQPQQPQQPFQLMPGNV